MHFQNLQDRHRLCIFNITLFAYDFLFEQHRNSYDECLMNRSTSNQGADMTMVHYLGQSNQDSENLSKGQKAWGKPLPEPLGALQQRILPDQTSSGDKTLLNRGNSLHSESVDIVEKILRKIKDPLG